MRRLLLAFLLAFTASADAAVTPNSQVTAQTPKSGETRVINGTSTITIANNGASVTSGTVTAYTCGTNGSKITGIVAASNDSAAMTLQVILVNTTVTNIATVTVPAGAGTTAGTPAVNVLAPTTTPGLPVDDNGNPYFFCVSGDTIQVGVQTTPVTSNKYVSVLVVAADY